MTEEKLSRVPFTVADEQMVASMAKWMRFIAIVTILSGLLMLFSCLLALVFGSTIVNEFAGAGKLGQLGDFIAAHQTMLLVWLLVSLVLSAASTYSGFVLSQAAEHFASVAKTDEADQDYLAAGFVSLKTFFMIQVTIALLSMLFMVFLPHGKFEF